MVQVKICGIRSLEEAEWAVEAGGDALGFVFAPRSKRYIEPNLVREITTKLPPFIAKVGVFVDTPPAQISEIARICGLTVIQLHGTEEPEDYREISLPILKALKVSIEQEISQETQENEKAGNRELEIVTSLKRWIGSVQGILVDSSYGGQFGGTGRALPWYDDKMQQLFEGIKGTGIPLILAGGLNPENVQEGISKVRPYAVDVSTGVESSGKKNRELIINFISQAKGFNCKHLFGFRK